MNIKEAKQEIKTRKRIASKEWNKKSWNKREWNKRVPGRDR